MLTLSALADGLLLIAEQRGSITHFVETGDGVEQFGVLDLTDAVRIGGEEGLLSIAPAPNFERDPYFYAYYSPHDGDYCSGIVWGLRQDPDAETGWSMTEALRLDARIVSFARDAAGEVHVLTFNGPILKLIYARLDSAGGEAASE